MKQRTINIVVSFLAVCSLIAGGTALLRSAPVPDELRAARTLAQSASDAAAAAAEQTKAVQDSLVATHLGPAHKTDAPNVAHKPTDLPGPISRSEPTTVQITLTTMELTAELADGVTYDFWTFNGTVPGPMLRVMEGDTVQLTLVNPATSKSGHNIDLHAVNGPGGGAAVTNVAPGETKSFTFKALNAGAFVYHCAFAPPMHHIAQGMYGAIIVEPKGGLPKVDREFYVMQGEWYTLGKTGEKGHAGHSTDKALAEQPDYITFNGHVDALTKLYPLAANVGEKVRIFFGVGGPNTGSNFHVIGEIFDKVYSGSAATFTANEETWYVPPGSVSTFEMSLNEPGSYTLVDHALFRVLKGAAGSLKVSGAWDPTTFMPQADGMSH